ncbi:aminotransferase class V-fold PLP-dependent enzyme [Telmatospirillum sp.]|uniref:pyridoxal phosphate-dependent decarboxylase family protein n=1 Tax=Telmatospirillum sp. TaxID=2079197 RepID=UPI00283BB25E|nr:aminotransferase class V-fold PLP-dependent enzyme [Telmatospirillum sp.]MDR3438751.1 aminotransferase class V-fold PLP-dependent enzyme [Telmatospirillum sp.]
MDFAEIVGLLYPYAERFPLNRALPEEGLSKDEILARLEIMARTENNGWENGRCSGTIYFGDHAHYEFLNKCFGYFSHVNSLQRDMCPSMNYMESEIISMTLEMLNAEAARRHNPLHQPCGVVGFGGTESILNAMLAYRNKLQAEKGIDRTEAIFPDTAHAAFAKAAHLFGMTLVVAPTDPVKTTVDVDFIGDHITERTAVVIGSAGNYPYGTIDPIEELSSVVLEKGTNLHVDACLGGWILPWGQALGYPNIPLFDFRLPGVTSISADTHKFGYGLKGTSILAWRDKSFRHHHYHLMPDWKGGAYASPGIAGSRSGGLIAATWAAMRHLGRNGYKEKAKRIFDTSFAMQDIIKSHAELRLMGSPTFCFSFTSDIFNIYHVNDFMLTRGWRFNGQQSPDAIHMCVTGPQTRPGVVDAFAADLADAVAYARQPPRRLPKSAGVYGGGGVELETDDSLTLSHFLTMAMDACQDGSHLLASH